ncbi:MAG: ATP-binding protein [Bacteroidales bacterium]|jgi:predicted AAA+ superfamily ATPase|nr:ATP-binding protein [Bacteroidales bacterium]
MNVQLKYYSRTIDNQLLAWKDSRRRKPLLLRGARQVGKSSAVRALAKHFPGFVEVNFDENNLAKEIFENEKSPKEICKQLSSLFGQEIKAGETLLFLDEIQSCLPAIESLRYFFEKMPDLHVVAAGSLLEFALGKISSYGVGRINHLFLYPFSFEEYLKAKGKHLLVDAYRKSSPKTPLALPLHKQLLKDLKDFLLIGGLPEAVAAYIETDSYLECQKVLDDLLVGFEDDFAKYHEHETSLNISEVFKSVVGQTEGKFVYEHVSPNISNYHVKRSLDLLIKAGLVYPVTHSAANGIPVGSESNLKYRRCMLFDTGLHQRLSGLDISQILAVDDDDFDAINKGAIAEIFVGQELLKESDSLLKHDLYCWHREAKNANAQIDYIVQIGQKIVPVEVKSGKKGSMNSLRIFMNEKQLHYGIRTSLENFGQLPEIDIYPLYAISNVLKNNNIEEK